MLRLLAIALPAFLLDQVTKYLVVWNIPFDPKQGGFTFSDIEGNREAIHTVVAGFFYLVHWGNTGAAFSVMSGYNGFFVVLSLVATAVILILNHRGAFADRLSQIGAGLLLGGIFGNVTDRLMHGHVVDFLLFDLHVRYANPWPAFNVADSCIFIAVCLFLIASFREERSKSKAKSETGA